MCRILRTPSVLRTAYSLTLLFTFALLLIGALLAMSALGARAESAGSTTVCPSGPPACDFASIQTAIDAAVAGDEIIVDAGVYSEALTLRDRLTIRGAESATTTLTAAAGPIVRASGIQSATLSHLELDGRGALASGMVVTDTGIALDHVVIRNLAGADGNAATSDGEDVTALSLFGTGDLSASDLRVQQLLAGNGYITYTWDFENDFRGGNAVGIVVSGVYTVNVDASIITDLAAGDAGNSADYPYACHGAGGQAIGIMASGSSVRLDGVEIRNLHSGAPCSGDAAYCEFGAGNFAGVLVRGGQLTITDSTISDLRAQAGHDSPLNVGLLAIDADLVRLKDVSVDLQQSTRADSGMLARGAAPDSPFCVPPPLAIHGVSVRGANNVDLQGLDIRNVVGYGAGAEGVGVFVDQATTLSLLNSVISNVRGGYGRLTAQGVSLADIKHLLVNATAVESIEADSAPPRFYYAYYGNAGGGATGFTASDIESGDIVGNAIWQVVAGRGTSLTSCTSCTGRPGGDAAGLVLQNARVTVAHNTIALTWPGAGGAPDGEDGEGYGVKSGGGDVRLAATVLAWHEVGILHTDGSIQLDQNDFWSNNIDADGVNPSPTDLYIDPGFVDINSGNLHLRGDSGLIDRADDYGAASLMSDIDGQPRPLDGNGDGVYRADIGADELFAVQDVLHVRATPGGAMAGAAVQVLAVIENPSADAQQTGVNFESVVPAGMTLSPDSLFASRGAASVTAQDGTQRVLWTGSIPVEGAVAIRYTLRVDQDDGAMKWVTLHAGATGDSAEMERQAQADILINPVQTYFPLVSGLE